MKTLFRTALTASALMLTGAAIGAPRTVTLEVENVSCVTCAPIVKRVLSRVLGVSQVTVVEQGGTATAIVIFDDEKVTPEALTQATTNAGYPSTVTDAKGAS
ncbi:cation transporter [Microvirga sp. G4-2]|uniref:cation transporter n=1 Tax=Microvirga sp. G4-2 TaxID=3434467 RepID=UPI004043BC36